MAVTLTLQQKVLGKMRALVKLCVVTLRFIVHPIDFLRLYQREVEVADSVLDVALLSLEQEFTERLVALEARVAQLESSKNVASGPGE